MPIIIIVVVVLLLTTKFGRKILAKVIGKLIGICLVLAAIGWGIYALFNHTGVVFAIIGILVGIFAVLVGISMGMDSHKERVQYKGVKAAWEAQTPIQIEITGVYNSMLPAANVLKNGDNNNVKFTESFPFGRVSYFLNFFNRELGDDEPLYFSPKRSLDSNELREYGTLITTSGLYLSYQTGNEKSDNFKDHNRSVYFGDLIGSSLSEDKNSLTIFTVNFAERVHLSQDSTSISLETIDALLKYVVSSGIAKSFNVSAIYDYADVVKEKEDEFLRNNAATRYGKAVEAAGVTSAMPQMGKVFDEVGFNMNQRQGHGTAAEYGNTTIDRILGRKVEHIGGNNAKDGADRIIHTSSGDTIMQTKYCRTASDTVSAYVKGHNYSADMKLEVPRDQFNDAITDFQKRIDSGELESRGIPKGSNAKDYVKKGWLTYAQSLNVAKAGTIESLTIDTMNGVLCSSTSGGITAILTYAVCMWNGVNPKEAAMQSLKAGAKVIGKSTAIYVVTMQLSRINVISNASKALAKKISSTKLAGSNFGKNLGLNQIKGQKVIGGTVMAAVTFGPDILCALVGRISFKQLLKNSAIGGAGIAGAAIGQTLIPIPVVGSMIGGAVAGFVAKKALDKFVEDDAIEMFAILKEEFIDVVPSSGLSQDEFNDVVSHTLAHPKLQSLLRDMYAYGDSREYAREHIVCVAVQSALSNRPMITEEMYIESLAELATSEA